MNILRLLWYVLKPSCIPLDMHRDINRSQGAFVIVSAPSKFWQADEISNSSVGKGKEKVWLAYEEQYIWKEYSVWPPSKYRWFLSVIIKLQLTGLANAWVGSLNGCLMPNWVQMIYVFLDIRRKRKEGGKWARGKSDFHFYSVLSSSSTKMEPRYVSFSELQVIYNTFVFERQVSE